MPGGDATWRMLSHLLPNPQRGESDRELSSGVGTKLTNKVVLGEGAKRLLRFNSFPLSNFQRTVLVLDIIDVLDFAFPLSSDKLQNCELIFHL